MKISDFLQIQPGITAVIGSGGKTSLLNQLCRELPGKVILCTTTHMFIPTEFPVFNPDTKALAEIMCKHRVICCGACEPNGKLSPAACTSLELLSYADYVLVEADGSKMLPMKAHAEYEPVIPEGVSDVIQVIGAASFGKPVCEVCHRPQLFASLVGCSETDLITPERIATLLRRENLTNRIYVNQCETAASLTFAHELSNLLEYPIWAGSLKEGWFTYLY